MSMMQVRANNENKIPVIIRITANLIKFSAIEDRDEMSKIRGRRSESSHGGHGVHGGYFKTG